MNWRRGLFRIWLVFALVWALGVGAVATYRWYTDPWRVVGDEIVDCKSHPGWCVYLPSPPPSAGSTDSQRFKEAWPLNVLKVLALAIMVPLVVLGTGLTVRWVVVGFAR